MRELSPSRAALATLPPSSARPHSRPSLSAPPGAARADRHPRVRPDIDRDRGRGDDRDGGQVRIIGPGETCARNETLVTWNVAGPAGPAGSAGTCRAAGTAGRQGPRG